MTTGNRDYSRHSPDVLLQGFLRKKMVFWCLVAAGIHVLLMLVTSTGYIRDLIDKEGAAARKAAAEAAAKAEEPPAVTDDVAQADDPTPVAESAKPAVAEEPVRIDGVAVPASAADSAIVKKITEVADPDQIPDEPDLGIDLDDTRVR